MQQVEKIINDGADQVIAAAMFEQLKVMSAGDSLLLTEALIPNLYGNASLLCTKNDMETIEADLVYYGVVVTKLKVKERNGRVEMAVVRV